MGKNRTTEGGKMIDTMFHQKRIKFMEKERSYFCITCHGKIIIGELYRESGKIRVHDICLKRLKKGESI